MNPNIDPQVVDFDIIIGNAETYGETKEIAQQIYPQFKWNDQKVENYDIYLMDELKEKADDLGVEVLTQSEYNRLTELAKKNKELKSENQRLQFTHTKLTKKPDAPGNPGQPAKQVNPSNKLDFAESMVDKTMIVDAVNGHGKSTLVKSIVEDHPQFDYKVFDVSQNWYHEAPLPYRIRVRSGDLYGVPMVKNCVYEMGSLSEVERREFVAWIIMRDYMERYYGMLMEGGKALDHVKTIIYIFEEANTYFSSSSLNKNDEAGQRLRDFVSVGRNFKLRGICVTTAMAGELATKFRRRSAMIIGKIMGADELHIIKKRTSKQVGERIKDIPKYNWVFYDGKSRYFETEKRAWKTPIDYKENDVGIIERGLKNLKKSLF